MKQSLFICAANELKIVNDVLRIPFGAYDHLHGTQIFGRADAAACVAAFNEDAAVPHFNGLPVYIGHPDVKAFQDKYRDHAAYGWIKTMVVNEAEHSLDLGVKWTPPGSELIANEQFVYFSPMWFAAQRAGNLHPFKIKSVGLTQEPNIRFLAVACEEQEGNIMSLLERLKALLPEAAALEINTDDEIVSFVQKMIDGLRALRESEKAKWEAESAAYETLENEELADVDAVKAYIATLRAKLDELAAAGATLEEVKTELGIANENLGGLRALYSAALLDQALIDGRITPATRKRWEARFADADFITVANELAAIDPQLKTKPVAGRKTPGAHGGETFEDVQAYANELSTSAGCSFEAAWARAKKDKRFAHLFPVKQKDAQ